MDYIYAQSVLRELNCRTLREFMQLLFNTDVCSFVNVFINFRANCHKAYKIYSVYVVLAPELA